MLLLVVKKLLPVFIFAIGFFIFTKPTYAQCASNTITCCNSPLQFQCNAGCNPDPITGACSCGGSLKCTTGTVQKSCFYNFGVCYNNYNTCNYVSGSCPAPNNTPPGGAVCGNGSCESGESNASCPADCPSGGPVPTSNPVGSCTNGSPFTGISNCGEVGRDPGAGSCGAGCLCCATKGSYTPSCSYSIWETGYPTCHYSEGLGCNPACQPPIALPGSSCSGCATGLFGPACLCPSPATCTATAPATATIAKGTLYPFQPSITSVGGTRPLTGVRFTSSNPSLASVSPDSSSTYTAGANVNGLNNGGPVNIKASIITVDANGSVREACSATTAVTIVNSLPPMTVDLKVNGGDGPLTVPANAIVNATWTATNATSCTGIVTSAPAGWAGNKAIPNGSQSLNVGAVSRLLRIRCTNTTTNETIDDVVAVNVGAPVPYCTINAPFSPITVVVNDTTAFTPRLTVNNGGIVSRVTYTSADVTRFIVVPPAAKLVAPYTMQVQGVAPGWRSMTMTAALTTGQTCTATVGVRSIVWLCGNPVPHDPPAMTCPSSPVATDGSVTWEWAPVTGATHYRLQVRRDDPYTGAIIYDSGARLGTSFFGPTCDPTQLPGAVCQYTTNNLAARKYYSLIQASSVGQCQPSNWSTPKEVDLLACATDPWWQAGNGNVVSNSGITSTLPDATQDLINDGPGARPGVAIFGTGSVNTGAGGTSSTSWAAGASYSAPVPNCQSFTSLVPTGTTLIDPGATPSLSAFTSGGTADSDGYIWYRHTGDMTINNAANNLIPAGRKVIVFVDSGDVTINGTIQFANRSNSFFMLIVNPTSAGARGNINISPSVTSPVGTPTLEGIFCSQKLSSGAGNTPLSIRGSVAALGGVTLERDLAIGNLTTPGEIFTMSPELLYNYPPALTFKRVSWQEVAP